ncbi:MAG: GGDEF domain-containing protein [Lachnospiraceae bacterium]|nr:GGDEF domain-containing protein [Lachnospiraceae bacterium]
MTHKKKIAIFGNGWNMSALRDALSGMSPVAGREDFDSYIFVGHASYNGYDTLNRGELNIYELPDIEDFDGAIVFSNLLNSDKTAEKICYHAKAHDVPIVSIGLQIPDIPYVGVNNETGMADLVTHLIEVHDIKHAVYIGGSRNHIENQIRLRTTRDVMNAHGLELKDEDIYYADWNNIIAAEVAMKYSESDEGVPDAFICANDIMALAVAAKLVDLGYDLPNDVIVTGFDNIEAGKSYYPTITTVSPNYDKVGEKAVTLLFDLINDVPTEKEVYVNSDFICCESCGCTNNVKYENIRRTYCQRSYTHSSELHRLDSEERRLFLHITTSTNIESFKASLTEYYTHNHHFTGDNFLMMFHWDYLKKINTDESEMFDETYKQKLDPIVALIDGKAVDLKRKNSHDLIPGYRKQSREQHRFFFYPLHKEQYNYGYMVFFDDSRLTTGRFSIFDYLEKIEQAIHFLRVSIRMSYLNNELSVLYDKDPMTGLFNRFCYEKKAIPLFDDCNQKGISMAIMFVDINYMKLINDKYGHLHGDKAILAVTKAITGSIPDGWLAIRYGGDEFLIVGSDCDTDKATSIKQSIMDYLDESNNNGSRPYNITASCGFVITDPAKQKTLQEYIRAADRIMYGLKREIHRHDNDKN